MHEKNKGLTSVTVNQQSKFFVTEKTDETWFNQMTER